MGVKMLERKSKSRKIEILPREPLTKKARAAIMQYVILAGEKKMHITFVLVNACLEAERMRRADLYDWLDARGYCWRPKVGVWLQSQVSEGR